jgi:hypothetical protein
MRISIIFLCALICIFMTACADISMELAGIKMTLPSSGLQTNQADPPAAVVKDDPCKSVPHTVYNTEKDRCDCIGGYRMTSGGCIPESSVECTFDQDCSPSGLAKSDCLSSTSKRAYRCDIRTYKCLPPEIVDCKGYGSAYVCIGGSCIYEPKGVSP